MAEAFTIYRQGRDVHLTLRGHFTSDDATSSTKAFIELVAGDDVRFVVNIGELTGYDKEARQLWQKILSPMRKRIIGIVFVGDPPPLVRMGAAAVAIAVGVHMRFIDNLDKLEP